MGQSMSDCSNTTPFFQRAVERIGGRWPRSPLKAGYVADNKGRKVHAAINMSMLVEAYREYSRFGTSQNCDGDMIKEQKGLRS
jgi:hypothetical protein